MPSGNEFRISYGNLSTIRGTSLSAGLTSFEWKYAILNAVEQWNNGANGGWFDFDGTSTVNWSPDTMCEPEEELNIVRVGYKGDGSGICDISTSSRLGHFR